MTTISTPTDMWLAYCAGLFDAEGSIQIKHDTLRVYVRLTNCSERAVNRFREILGVGSVRSRVPEGKAPLYTWYLSDTAKEPHVVRDLLAVLGPFLHVQADVYKKIREYYTLTDKDSKSQFQQQLKHSRTRFPGSSIGGHHD